MAMNAGSAAASDTVVRDENVLLNRPFTAYFTPQVRLPTSDVFTALREANVDSKDVSCLQRTSNGQVVLTFRRAECKEQFLRKSVLKVGSTPYALQDVDWPLVSLQVYDAPQELPDLAIIPHLFSTVMLSIIAVVISPNLAGNMFMMAFVITVFASNAPSRVF